MISFLHIKALHLIFVVTWFAGLFYLVRLFVYHAEAFENRTDNEQTFKILHQQFSLMEKRLLFGITWPSAVLTLVFGGLLAKDLWPWHEHIWLHYKFLMLFVLYAYHFSCHYLFRLFQKEICKYNSNRMRLWNEVPTVLLFGIVFTAILKNILDVFWGLGFLLAFSVLLMIAVKIYRKMRINT